MHKSALAGVAMALLVTGGAMAQDTAAFTALTACRIDAERVSLSYRYIGGACEAALPSKIEVMGEALKVSVPTANTSEICTQQLIEIDGGEMLSATLVIKALDVTVYNPQGAPQATGVAPLVEPPECTIPEPVNF
jgi:hypothetical protein